MFHLADALGQCDSQQESQEWRGRLSDSLKSGETMTYERVRTGHEGRARILEVSCTPLADDGNEQGGRGILLLEDVTDEVLMQGDLASAERLAAVGRLAARVAHELNNPLDGILRYVNLAQRVAGQHGLEQIAHYLQQSRVGLQRMIRIISELLEFSRSTYSAVEEADINKIVEEAYLAMESAALEAGAEVLRDYSKDMPNVRSGNLFQVFCNLIKNAVDAMAEHCQAGAVRRLTVRTYCDATNAVIDFCDTGPGLSAEVQAKLFEPFFTTKATSKGTGLGLAICKDIVDRYGGQIMAENHSEGGSRFTVNIPLERTSRSQ